MGKGDKWVFTLHKPSLIPLLTYSTRRDLREKIYKAYLNRCNNGDEYDNKQLINDFIRLRTEKAHLLGYPSYAAYVVADEMAGTTDAVYGLLDQIWEPALERAKGELSEMDTLLQKDIPGATFESWDWWYYAEKLRKQNYALDEEMLRPYFSLENVQGGIFYLANRLYGITFQPVVVPLYHPDAVAYQVLDADGSHLGVLYFDYFPRDGKSQGAWCGNYVEQTYKDGKRVAPVVSVVCNFTRPVGNTPALLTLDETETLFHEFGHALHFLFHDVKYRGLSEVEGDFVELPSQVMENWAFEPEMLKHYAVHYRTGEVIPKYLVDKLRKSELFNQGFATTELIAASLSDMDIHSVTEYEPFDPMAFERQALNEKRGLIPQIEPRYRYPYFSHIFDGGYSAATISIPGPRCSTRIRSKPSARAATCSTRRSPPISAPSCFRAAVRRTACRSTGHSAAPTPTSGRCCAAADSGTNPSRNPPTKAKRSFSRKYGRNSPIRKINPKFAIT